jgi:NDP-sugar pyrophosphorylase family protein
VAEPSRCGVAITDDSGVIIDFEEKPENPRCNWVFSGLMVAGPGFFDVIPPCIPADIAFHVLPHLLGKMRAFPIADYLLDIGTMTNYQKAQTTWPGNAGSLSPDQSNGEAFRTLPPRADPDIRGVLSGGKS